MSWNVGGILVGKRSGGAPITPRLVAGVIQAYWVARGGRVVRSSRGHARTTDQGARLRLGYAVSPATDGWIAVADSERYHADHGLAQHLARTLKAPVLWYTLYGATDAGIARWFGCRRKPPPATYGEVETYVQRYPNACVYFDQVTALDDVERLELAEVPRAQYEIGPVPTAAAEADDAADDDVAEIDVDPVAAAAAVSAGVGDPGRRAPFTRITIPARRGGRLAGRDTLSFGLSCAVPIQEMAGAARAALDRYLAVVPAGALEWSLIGSSSTKVGPVKLARARGLLDPKRQVATRPAYFFLSGGADDPDDAPSWLFCCHGEQDVRPQQMSWGELRRTTQLELRFPSDYLWQQGVDRFIEFVAGVTALVPVESGFVSIALSWSPLWSTISQDAPASASAIVAERDGLDLYEPSYRLGGRCRGAQWLTILGPALVDRLGGPTALGRQLDPGVGMITAGAAVILRAGDVPLPDLPADDRALRESVARAVRPVTHFGCHDHAFRGAAADRARWLYRFVGGPPR